MEDCRRDGRVAHLAHLNECTPHDFEITNAPPGLVVRIEFTDDAMAEAFKREFAR